MAHGRFGEMRDMGEAAFDAIKLALVVIKLRQGSDSTTDITLSPEECGRVVQAMQLLKDGPG